MRPCERFLTPEEYRCLGRVLQEAEGTTWPPAIAAIRLLMLTGCRSSEILNLRWDDVDRTAGELRLRDTKTGPRMVPMTAAALDVLDAIPRSPGNPWVIPAQKGRGRLPNLYHYWRPIRAQAGLHDVRINDLRHSFASRALALGESLPMMGLLKNRVFGASCLQAQAVPAYRRSIQSVLAGWAYNRRFPATPALQRENRFAARAAASRFEIDRRRRQVGLYLHVVDTPTHRTSPARARSSPPRGSPPSASGDAGTCAALPRSISHVGDGPGAAPGNHAESQPASSCPRAADTPSAADSARSRGSSNGKKRPRPISRAGRKVFPRGHFTTSLRAS